MSKLLRTATTWFSRIAWLTAGVVPLAHAEESGTRGAFGVTLQPFSTAAVAARLEAAEAVRVAYYSPRAQPVAPARARPAEADEEVASSILSSGPRRRDEERDAQIVEKISVLHPHVTPIATICSPRLQHRYQPTG